MAGYKSHDNDAGSTQVQVARLSARIEQISTHLRANRKDYSSKRGLEAVLSQRKRLLRYLYRTDRRAGGGGEGAGAGNAWAGARRCEQVTRAAPCPRMHSLSPPVHARGTAPRANACSPRASTRSFSPTVPTTPNQAALTRPGAAPAGRRTTR